MHLQLNLTARPKSLMVRGLSYFESIPGSIGLIFEAADEQRLRIPVPSIGINIQIVMHMERKQVNLK